MADFARPGRIASQWGNPYACRRLALGRRMIVAARETGSLEGAVASLRRAAALDPGRAQIWRQLGDHLDASGDRSEAANAYLTHVRYAIYDPALMAAASAL